jgi:type I restriction enzyme S subunit
LTKELSESFWFQEGPGVRNWQFTDVGIKLLNVSNITKAGEIDLSKTDRRLSEEEVRKKYAHFLVDEGDLVIASSGISFEDDGLLRTRGAFIGKTHLPLCMNTSTIRFKAKIGISDLRYLKYWLDSHEFRSQITRLVTGSAQQNFGPSHLREIHITLPTIEKQRQVSALLVRVDRLRRTRRYALELTNAFLSATFLEFFGDRHRAARDYPTQPLEELVQPDRGITYGIVQAGPHIPDGVPYIKTGDIIDGVICANELSRTAREIAKSYQRSEVKFGDLVMSIRATVGTIAVLPETLDGANLTQGTARIAPGPKVDKLFLLWQIRMPEAQRWISQQIKGTTFLEITLGRLREMPIFVPPLPLQRKFAALVERVERLRAVQREALRQAEHLFSSLLDRAFSG